MKRRILLAAFGAVLFFAFDSIHVRAGIWSAGRSDGVPWWYVFVYFSGIFAAASGLRRFERRYERSLGETALALDIGAFVLLLVLHLLLFRSEVVLAVTSLAVLGVRMLVFRRPGDLMLGLFIAGLDAIVEWAMASRGLFAYSHARFALLPLWLLPFWAGLGMSLRGFFLVADGGIAVAPLWRHHRGAAAAARQDAVVKS
jgi:hypothetical protein